jgi:hypothetical protein
MDPISVYFLAHLDDHERLLLKNMIADTLVALELSKSKNHNMAKKGFMAGLDKLDQIQQ